MDWIINKYRKLMNLTFRRNAWKHMSTSIWQLDPQSIPQKKTPKSYVSAATLIKQINAGLKSEDKLAPKKEVFPSVLNKFEQKFQPNRIMPRRD